MPHNMSLSPARARSFSYWCPGNLFAFGEVPHPDETLRLAHEESRFESDDFVQIGRSLFSRRTDIDAFAESAASRTLH